MFSLSTNHGSYLLLKIVTHKWTHPVQTCVVQGSTVVCVCVFKKEMENFIHVNLRIITQETIFSGNLRYYSNCNLLCFFFWSLLIFCLHWVLAVVCGLLVACSLSLVVVHRLLLLWSMGSRACGLSCGTKTLLVAHVSLVALRHVGS